MERTILGTILRGKVMPTCARGWAKFMMKQLKVVA